jgi:AcrR family transcriptional regulator
LNLHLYASLRISAKLSTVSVMSTEAGLRERKKAATRTALSQAAMRLAIERGVENVTADAIAEAANVCPRTLHNYFSCKEEAILAALEEQIGAMTDAVRARPADEPIWDVLQHVALSQLTGGSGDPAEIFAQMRVVKTSPALLALDLALFDEMERMFAEAIAERTGTDAEVDLYPSLLSAAAAAAMKTALKLVSTGRNDASQADLITEAFASMRAGLPEPVRSTP